MAYDLIITAHAQRQLDGLERQSVYSRLKSAINALAADPRPRGYRKLANSQSLRIRVREYRVIYDVADEVRIVSITRVGHRRDVYRTT